jgi:hypothetical protein
VGPKHVEIRRYMNKIEIVTSVGFLFYIFNLSNYTRYILSVQHISLKRTSSEQMETVSVLTAQHPKGLVSSGIQKLYQIEPRVQ